ncbi:unnamed protein product [Clavelina lepadiformis]|uniref:Hydantoinase B/oxoprolinase domain-containing protein n=1 Tax=Clavelina lepadiformis TaxID=159417 RepID=A0ABP0G6E2_CLALP
MNRQELLDFSCAFFGHDGCLVSNAPHIPVHLGAMQDGVQYQMWAIDINKGDCILSNHPCAEGVHLPDLTVKVTAILMPPGDFARCSGTHNLHGNLADLRALVAANQKALGDPPGPGAYIVLRVGSGPSLHGTHPKPRRGRGQKSAARRVHDNGRRTSRFMRDGRRISDQPPRGDRPAGGQRDVRFRGDIPYGDKQLERAESDQQVCHHLLPQVHGGLRHPS